MTGCAVALPTFPACSPTMLRPASTRAGRWHWPCPSSALREKARSCRGQPSADSQARGADAFRLSATAALREWPQAWKARWFSLAIIDTPICAQRGSDPATLALDATSAASRIPLWNLRAFSLVCRGWWVRRQLSVVQTADALKAPERWSGVAQISLRSDYLLDLATKLALAKVFALSMKPTIAAGVFASRSSLSVFSAKTVKVKR